MEPVQPHRFGIVAFLSVVVLVAVGFYFLGGSGFVRKYFSLDKEVIGNIYLSLLPLSSDVNRSIYSIDIEKGVLTPFITDRDDFSLTGTFSPDGSIFAYARISSTSMNIYVHPSSGKDYALTGDRSLKIRRNPVWSPDGSKIAYIARKDFDGGSPDLDSWLVYVFDRRLAKETFITVGGNPMFAPDGSLLVLKSDGLYRINLSTNIGEKIWWIADGKKAFAGAKLNISKDGSYIAWATASLKKIDIIRVDSWNPFSGNIVKTISSTAFWPVFSPDSNWLAYLEFDSGNTPHPRLVILNIQSGNKKNLLDLSNYDDQKMFLTEWR